MNIQAQDLHPEKGDFTVAAGVGLIPTFSADGGTVNVLPLTLNVGYRITDAISLNAYGGFTSATSQPQITSDGIAQQYQNDLLMVGVRSEIHTDRFENFDIYGSVMLSYFRPHVYEQPLDPDFIGKGTPVGPSQDKPYQLPAPEGKLVFAGAVGGTWFVSPHFGVFGEVGYGISLATAGLQYKF